MKKIILLVLLIYITPSIFSQEKVLELGEIFSKRKDGKKDSYALSNQKNKNLVLIAKEGSSFNAILLNPEFKTQQKLSGKPMPRSYTNLIGYDVNGEIYNVVYINNFGKKFAMLQIDFPNYKIIEKKLDLKLKFERYLTSLTYNNKLYIITTIRNSSNLNFYSINSNSKIERNIINLEKANTKDKYGKIKTLYHILSSHNFNVVKVESSYPNGVQTTSTKIKLYLIGNTVILSFDNNHKNTQLCYIDMDTFDTEFKSFDKPEIIESDVSKSNSYIFNDKLFQVTSSEEKIKFTISDLQKNKVLKAYEATTTDSLWFKNSPIIQEGDKMFSSAESDRISEIEKTSKFLRKISNRHLGISSFKVNKKYTIAVGGSKEIIRGGGAPVMTGGNLGTANGVPIASASSDSEEFNSTFNNYNGYCKTKSTYINCLFDENFEHIKGNIPYNVFDRVLEFSESLKKEISAVNIFTHNSYVHYGFFDKNDRIFKVYKFEK